MAPVITSLKASSRHEVKVCLTGQHMDLVTPIMSLFNIAADYSFEAMSEAAGPQELTSVVMRDVTKVIEEFRPDLVLVHGDTTSSLASALAAFYMKVAIGHVEAGLRTESIMAPWPEECNRRLISVMTDIHFAPTENAYQALLKEGICPSKIHITGNTVIDALFATRDIIHNDNGISKSFRDKYPIFNEDKRFILVTAHRRENIGSGIKGICDALLELNKSLPGHQIILPSHPNPVVRDHFLAKLGNVNGISVLPPLDYTDFVIAMGVADIILTDSGGIQEEAPSFNVPVLVLRDQTERPEAVSAGTALLVGTETGKIVQAVMELTSDSKKYEKISKAQNPYGNGTAASAIEAILAEWLRIK